jgi:hypothetical protein
MTDTDELFQLELVLREIPRQCTDCNETKPTRMFFKYGDIISTICESCMNKMMWDQSSVKVSEPESELKPEPTKGKQPRKKSIKTEKSKLDPNANLQSCRKCRQLKDITLFVAKSGESTKACTDCLIIERRQETERRIKAVESDSETDPESGIKLRRCIDCKQKKDSRTFVTTTNESSKKCGDCLKKWRERENFRIEEKDADNNLSHCVECKKMKNSGTFLTTYGGDSNKCGDCLKKRRVIERRRVRPHKNKNIAVYSKTYRNKKKEEMGSDEYNAMQAEKARQWRANHREEMAKQYERNIGNLNARVQICKYSAKQRNISFYLSDDEVANLMRGSCYYCGQQSVENVRYNGIDRKDSTIKAYASYNCVSCCSMCNYMKCDNWNDDDFIDVVEHILSVNGFAPGRLFPHQFSNSKSLGYSDTQKSAVTREIPFRLTETEFIEIKKGNCYLCGKENSFIHKNGIDRVDNDIGYVKHNCQACCSSCNYLKKNYDLLTLFCKLIKIFHHSVRYVIPAAIANEKYKHLWAKVKPNILPENHVDRIVRTRRKTGLNCNTGKLDDSLVTFIDHAFNPAVYTDPPNINFEPKFETESNSEYYSDFEDSSNSSEYDLRKDEEETKRRQQLQDRQKQEEAEKLKKEEAEQELKKRLQQKQEKERQQKQEKESQEKMKQEQESKRMQQLEHERLDKEWEEQLEVYRKVAQLDEQKSQQTSQKQKRKPYWVNHFRRPTIN